MDDIQPNYIKRNTMNDDRIIYNTIEEMGLGVNARRIETLESLSDQEIDELFTIENSMTNPNDDFVNVPIDDPPQVAPRTSPPREIIRTKSGRSLVSRIFLPFGLCQSLTIYVFFFGFLFSLWMYLGERGDVISPFDVI